MESRTGPSPVDRAKTGSKDHVIADGNGIPLALSLTGGDRNDVTQVMPLLRDRSRQARPGLAGARRCCTATAAMITTSTAG
ncbi:hypothetical protein [Nonomuraea maritima]|uniref:hypothetical protein n=1 Tax=Nonomuraea maritima TaxID=683260 RepID=UPI003717A0B3